MRDDDDGFSVVPHRAQHGEQLFDLLRGEHRRGLVQNENFRTAVQRFDDFRRLFFGDGHLVNLFPGIDVKAVFFGDLGDLFIDLSDVVLFLLCLSENDVLPGRKNVHQLEMLVHHADPVMEGVLRRADQDLFAADINLAFVGIINSRQHVHQRRLSAAVLAEHGQNLPFIQSEIDVLVRHDVTERLGDVSEFQHLFLFHFLSSAENRFPILFPCPSGVRRRKPAPSPPKKGR